MARTVDPDAEIMINDYDIVRSDMGQCVLDLIEGYDIDYLGVQGHMHPGSVGDIIYERLDDLSINNRKLIVTEFDSKHWNIDERALDYEDYMRQVI